MKVPEDEDIIFWFHLHPLLLWMSVLLLAALVVWDSRRRFLTYPLFAISGKR
jgi:hypothetical protein